MDKKNMKHLPLKISITLMSICLILSLLLFIYLYNNDSPLFGTGYYIVLILLGISIGGLLFGALESYLELSGSYMNLSIRAGGPVAFIILIIVGGHFYRVSDPDITFRLELLGIEETSNLKNLIESVDIISNTKGTSYSSSSINQSGIVTFDRVPSSLRNDSIRVTIKSKTIMLVNSNDLYRITDQSYFKVMIQTKLPSHQKDTIQ